MEEAHSFHLGQAVTTEPCVHWDKIEMPNGPVAKAKCKKCGREKEYQTTYGYQYSNKPNLGAAMVEAAR